MLLFCLTPIKFYQASSVVLSLFFGYVILQAGWLISLSQNMTDGPHKNVLKPEQTSGEIVVHIYVCGTYSKSLINIVDVCLEIMFVTASSRGLKCKMFCKIFYTIFYTLLHNFLHNFCHNFFSQFLQIDLGFGHDVPIFWLILFSRRVCKMRDWQSLLLFFFCRKFKKYFAKLLQTFCNKFSSSINFCNIFANLKFAH